MNTNKPTLTKEQAEAMEEISALLSHGYTKGVWSSKDRVVSYKLHGYGFKDKRSIADTISDDDFIKALYIGYEVEKTPEERIQSYYARLDKRPLCEPHTDYYVARGIRKTLDTLGITIEGVND